MELYRSAQYENINSSEVSMSLSFFKSTPAWCKYGIILEEFFYTCERPYRPFRNISNQSSQLEVFCFEVKSVNRLYTIFSFVLGTFFKCVPFTSSAGSLLFTYYFNCVRLFVQTSRQSSTGVKSISVVV